MYIRPAMTSVLGLLICLTAAVVRGRGTSNLAPRVGHVASLDLNPKPRSPEIL